MATRAGAVRVHGSLPGSGLMSGPGRARTAWRRGVAGRCGLAAFLPLMVLLFVLVAFISHVLHLKTNPNPWQTSSGQAHSPLDMTDTPSTQTSGTELFGADENPSFASSEDLSDVAGTATVDPNATPATTKQTLYLSMQLNEGRLNNQLRSLDGAMRWAKALGRTLFIQSPCLHVVPGSPTYDYDRMVACKNQWIGLEHGLWDLSEVRRKFDFLLEEDVVRTHGSLDKHPVLGKPTTGCNIGVMSLPTQAEKLAHCAHIYVECAGVFPWVVGTTEALGVPRTEFLQALKPALYLQAAARDYMRQIQDPLPKPFVTVHLRTFQESIRYQTKDNLERQKRAKKHCSEVIGRQTRDMPANPQDLFMLEFCNLTETSINLGLAKAGLPELSPDRPFFFAGSDELDGSPLVQTLKSLGASKFDYKEFIQRPTDKGGSRKHLLADGFVKQSCALNEMALLDMIILTQGDFFIGNPSSTFSQYVCILRGQKRASDSNMCVWQLQKYGLLPQDAPAQVLKKVEIAQSDASLRPQSTAVVSAAWQWSSDRQFIMLDSYLIIHNDKPLLLVLGDGKLPMKSMSPTAYEPDLSCEWVDSGISLPAQVVLMSGGKVTENGFLYDEPVKSWPEPMWPLSIAQAMHTSYILCPLPEGLPEEEAAAQPGGVKVSGGEGSFSLVVDTRRAVPRTSTKTPPGAGRSLSATHCLCPVYDEGISGLKKRDPRLLLEWLVHHQLEGFAHVHAYMQDYDDPVSRAVLDHFSRKGFVTVHDWSRGASQGVSQHTYQKAKYLAMADCWLRSRGATDFVAVGDIDEAVHFQQPLDVVLQKCVALYAESQRRRYAFSVSSKTVLPFLSPTQQREGAGALLLELMSRAEKQCKAPFNCGKYHRGRQKYFLRVAETDLPLVVPWTHGVSRNYTLADAAHVQLGEDQVLVRHYSGQWYKESGLKEEESQLLPLPDAHLAAMRAAVAATGLSHQIYGLPQPVPASSSTPVGPAVHEARAKAVSGSRKRYRHSDSGPFECSTALANQQTRRFMEAKRKNWRFTSCPDAAWLHILPQIWKPSPLTLVDIGCNKGYTSARMFATFASSLEVNAQTLHKQLRNVMVGPQFAGGACGVCGDCNEEPPPPTPPDWPLPDVHCVEPSPPTYKLLTQMRDGFSSTSPKIRDHWHIYNLGMAETERQLMFEGPAKEPNACASAGQETCGMVDKDTMTGIGTVYVNGSSVAAFFQEHALTQVDVLKIDAEGFDPLVLDGAYSVLAKDGVRVLMFEYHGLGVWKSRASLQVVVERLDVYGWDCYLDGAPELTRLTRCWTSSLEFRWWSNVVCFKRDSSDLADTILNDHAKFLWQ